MKVSKIAASLSLSLLILAADDLRADAVPPPAPPSHWASLHRCIEERAARDGFSGVVSAFYRGRPVVSLARGRLAGPESPAISAAARFNLASASKMFTAVAVAQLVDAGRIALSDPIGDHVSGLTPEASRVTVAQLLTHTSGLGSFFGPQNMEAMLRARTASDLLPLLAAEVPAFPPGSRFEYSNSGFALLGVLIERVTGETYGDYLRRHIFEPAGMAATGVAPEPLPTLAVAMTARSPGGPGNATPPAAATLHSAPGATVAYGSPAGGVFGTAADMQRFMAALVANRLTRPATTAALVSAQVEAAPAAEGRPARRYGLGFGVGEADGRRWFGHNGGSLGANVEIALFPDDPWSLVILSNRDPPSATDLYRYVRELILDPAKVATCGDGGAPQNRPSRPLGA